MHQDGQASVAVALRWRDLDHQGHVYHATMLTLLDEARTEWLRAAVGVESPDEYVVARVEIDFLAETVRSNDRIDVTFDITRVGSSSLTTTELVRTPDGRDVVRAAVTAVMWDRVLRKPRPLTDAERHNAAAWSAVRRQEQPHV
ncbi:thioesterase family protein [Actinomadura vinacea]|uniref:Thioesterase family protein n=1 Tax=Actinomadura vinacea TaxID=115336 RepID=A0ABN3JE41_9ACTN